MSTGTAMVWGLRAAVAAVLLLIVAAAWAADRRRHPMGPDDVDAAAMLDAIAAVESGHNPRAVGKHGERGRCQFTRATWQGYTDAPWESWAGVDCPLTRKVERAHLAWLCECLRALHPHLEPEFIAAGWRWGPRLAAAHVRTDYARRVAALYRERVEAVAP